MPDRENVIKWLDVCKTADRAVGLKEDYPCRECPYKGSTRCMRELVADAFALLNEQEKETKALRLLVEWAEECDFGFDQFPDEYERYKDEIKDMKYIDGMIHVAKRTLEDHGAFEGGR